MTDVMKKLIEYSREDFDKLIMEKAKPVKPIMVYYRVRRNSISKTNKPVTSV